MMVFIQTERCRGVAGFRVDVFRYDGEVGEPLWAGFELSEVEAYLMGRAWAENRGHRVSASVRAR